MIGPVLGDFMATVHEQEADVDGIGTGERPHVELFRVNLAVDQRVNPLPGQIRNRRHRRSAVRIWQSYADYRHCARAWKRLEDELQSQLQNARAGGAGNLAVADILIAVARGPGSGRSATKQVDSAPLGMVEGVIAFRAKLQGAVLAFEPGHVNVAEDGDIPIVAAGPGEGIFAHIAEHAGLVIGGQLADGNLAQKTWIEPSGGGAELRIIKDALADAQSTQGVAAGGSADAGGQTINTALNAQRRAAHEAGDAADLPAAEGITGELVGGLLEERQLVDVIEDENLSLI